jgi:predicted amidohydrolase
MKSALIINPVGPKIQTNLDTIIELSNQAAKTGAQIAVFPEAALTGLINNDNPEHDLPLGQTIPGEFTKQLSIVATRNKIWIAIGLLEREEDKLFDSAILISSGGETVLKYRRITSRWHGSQADESVYCSGREIPTVMTEFGKIAFLICGDLFDNKLVKRFKALKCDYLLFPFCRQFNDRSFDQNHWELLDQPKYAMQTKLIGVTSLMTNYLAVDGLADDYSFGGAMAISGKGVIINSFPLGESGILVVDV